MSSPEVHSLQESLFITDQSGSQVVMRDFGSEMGAIGLAEQKLHLINTLNLLAGASMRAGLAQIGDTGVIADRYGDEASSVVKAAEQKRQELMLEAKVSFARGTGHYALVDAEVEPMSETKRRTKKMFTNFLGKYYGARNHQALQQYRSRLVKEVSFWTQEVESDVSVFNREQGIRPHMVDKATEIGQDAEQLDTRERLEAILGDPRAGFIPTTNSEKNQIISWLDYLDDPQKELGIVHQLREVFVNAQRPARRSLGVAFGIRALESIAWEVGDYLHEAQHRLQAAERLCSSANQDQRPDISLFEEFSQVEGEYTGKTLEEIFGEYWFALAAYVQYKDTVEYIHGEDSDTSNPLTESELPPSSQRPKFDASPGKRKAIHNQYTRVDIKESYKAHIISRLRGLRIRDIRVDTPELLSNYEQQVRFHHRRIGEFDDFKTMSSKTREPLIKAVATVKEKYEELGVAA